MNTTAAQPAADLIDSVAGLAPGSPTFVLRHARDKVALATQGSYDALFDPQLPGLSLAERLLVAVYVCRLTPAPSLLAHYLAQLDAVLAKDGNAAAAAARALVERGDPAQCADTRLRAMLQFTRTLIERPIEGDRAALETLPAAGISTPAVVTLAQLIAFLSYQTRMVAGLAALRDAAR